MKNTINTIGYEKLCERCSKNVKVKYSEKIISINYIGQEDVYDMEVEKNSNFIANNFIVHNSSEDWAKAQNKTLKKKLAEVRTKHLLFILCFPLKIYYHLQKLYFKIRYVIIA